MTPERALELSQLEPPRSIKRMAQFLDELAKRSELLGRPAETDMRMAIGGAGFNADRWVATMVQRSVEGTNRLQTWLPLLMREYQVELRDLREFAVWLMKWNDKRSEVEVLRVPLAEYFGSAQAGARAAAGLTPYAPGSAAPTPYLPFRGPMPDARPIYVTADQQQRLLGSGNYYANSALPQYQDAPRSPQPPDTFSRAWNGARQTDAPFVPTRRPIMNTSGYVVGEAAEPAMLSSRMGTSVQMVNRSVWTANAAMAIPTASAFAESGGFSRIAGLRGTSPIQPSAGTTLQAPYLDQSLSHPPVPTASWTGMAPPTPDTGHSAVVPNLATVPTSPLPSPAQTTGEFLSRAQYDSGPREWTDSQGQSHSFKPDPLSGAPSKPSFSGDGKGIREIPELTLPPKPQYSDPRMQPFLEPENLRKRQFWPGALAWGAVAAAGLSFQSAHASVPGLTTMNPAGGPLPSPFGFPAGASPFGSPVLSDPFGLMPGVPGSVAPMPGFAGSTRVPGLGGYIPVPGLQGPTSVPGLTNPAVPGLPFSTPITRAAGIVPTRDLMASGPTGSIQLVRPGQQPDLMPPITSTAITPEMGMLTLMAPPIRVASRQSEQGGAAVALDFKSLALGAGMLDSGGLARLKSVLPADAQALYPALPTSQLPAHAVNLQIAPNLLQELLQQSYGDRAATMAHAASRMAHTETISTPSVSPVQAQIVPTGRPMGDHASVLPPSQNRTGGGALAEAKSGQSVRGGVLDFLGMPVRLAPSLGGRSELSHEVDLRKGLSADPGAPLRPEMFDPLRSRLFPSVQSINAEPDKQAWRQAAPSFGMRSSEATSLLAPDSRVAIPTGGAPIPQSTGPAAARLMRMGLSGAMGESGGPASGHSAGIGPHVPSLPPSPFAGASSPGHAAPAIPSLPTMPHFGHPPGGMHTTLASHFSPSLPGGFSAGGAPTFPSAGAVPHFGTSIGLPTSPVSAGSGIPSSLPHSPFSLPSAAPSIGGLTGGAAHALPGIIPHTGISSLSPAVPSMTSILNGDGSPKLPRIGSPGILSGAGSFIPGGGSGAHATAPLGPSAVHAPTGHLGQVGPVNMPATRLPGSSPHSAPGSSAAPSIGGARFPTMHAPHFPAAHPGPMGASPSGPASLPSMPSMPHSTTPSAPRLPSITLPHATHSPAKPMQESSSIIARSAPDRLFPAVHVPASARPPLAVQALPLGKGATHGSQAEGARDAHRATQMSTKDQAAASSDVNMLATEVWSLLKRRILHEAERAGKR